MEKRFVKSNDTISLEAYIESKNPGDDMSYLDIKEQTGIDVRTTKGRGSFYSACRSCNCEFKIVRGFGYIKSHPKNANEIVGKRTKGAQRAGERLETTSTHIIDQHGKDMPPSQVAAIEQAKYAGAAIAGQARTTKTIVVKEQIRISEAKPTV